jgi:hypothetical protein
MVGLWGRRFAALALGLAMAVTTAGSAAAAPWPEASRPRGYADQRSGVEVRLHPNGRFLVVTPNGTCGGYIPPVTEGRGRVRVVSGGEGCVVDFYAGRRRAQGWVLLPAERYRYGGEYLKLDFDARLGARVLRQP